MIEQLSHYKDWIAAAGLFFGAVFIFTALVDTVALAASNAIRVARGKQKHALRLLVEADTTYKSLATLTWYCIHSYDSRIDHDALIYNPEVERLWILTQKASMRLQRRRAYANALNVRL